MSNSEIRQVNIPHGATIRATRSDGSEDIYVFQGSDQQGVIYEDAAGQRHSDIGIYNKLEIKTKDGWEPV